MSRLQNNLNPILNTQYGCEIKAIQSCSISFCTEDTSDPLFIIQKKCETSICQILEIMASILYKMRNKKGLGSVY